MNLSIMPPRRRGVLPAGRAILTAFCLLALAGQAPAAANYTQLRDLSYAQPLSAEQPKDQAHPGADAPPKAGAPPLDTAQQCDVLIPEGPGPFPGVLLVHGGAWLTGDKSHMRRVAKALAEHGYTVCSINYRLAPKHPFPAQIDDCKMAVRWLRTHAAEFKLDPARLGGYGYSAGGHLVALLGVTDPKDGLEGAGAPAEGPGTRLQCYVAGGAPCDFRSIPDDNSALAYWLGGSRAEKPLAYQQASPMHFVTADDPPSFFFHGEADSLVPFSSPRRMTEQLTATGTATTLYTIPAAGHIEAFFNDGAMTAAIEFLDKHLQPAAKTDLPTAKTDPTGDK